MTRGEGVHQQGPRHEEARGQVVLLERRRRPGSFQSARNCISGIACAAFILPAKPLLFKTRGSWLGANTIGWRRCAVRLTKRMSASNKRDGFFIIHRHASESVSDILGCCKRIRHAVGAFRINVNQPHLDGS